MMLFFLFQAQAADLWDRCAVERLATVQQAEQGRQLQRQALISREIARIGLERLVDDAPRCPTTLMILAGMNHAAGEDELGRARLERALTLADWPEIQRAAAMAAAAEGDPSLLEEAVESNPQDPELLLAYIESLSPSERTAMLREAIELHPNDAGLAEAAILGLSDAGYLLEAVRTGAKLAERHPHLAPLVASLSAQFDGPPEPRERRRATEVNLLEDGTEEIVVYSPTKAKERLGKRLEELGWTKSKPVRGGVRYESAGPMKPWVEIYDNGEINVQKSGMVSTSGKPDQTVRVGKSGVDLGGGTGITYGANRVSKRKMAAARSEVMESIWLEVTEWRQARARVEFQAAVLEDLPDKLTALWERGTPFYGKATLASPAERRAAMLQHWASRACTEAGDAVRTEVSRFLALEVNESPTPLTPEEVAEAEKACVCPEARLSLSD